MAALKVRQLRGTLAKFAELYDRAEAREQATVLRRLNESLAKADNLTVDEVMGALQKVGQRHHLPNNGDNQH